MLISTMLPVIGACPECGSADDVIVLSHSRATYEVFCQCNACGGDWWEQEGEVLDPDTNKAAA